MNKELLNKDNTFKYQLLDRMRSDCDYYLGNGNFYVKHLWSGSVDQHIKDMKELYLSFPREERPEWISLYDINEYSKKMDHRPVIWSDKIGSARLIDIIHQKKDRTSDEIFFSIKYRPFEEHKNEYGYMKVTPRMREIFNTLIQERKENMHIEFIEWEDSWNMVFEDGIYISSKMCRVEKRDFAEWRREVK